MATDSSFDIVCRVDLQEVRNAIQHSMKEIDNRFDFKGSHTAIRLVDDLTAIELVSSDETRLRSALDVLETKLVKREVPLKALDRGDIESALGGTVRLRVGLQSGIPVEKAREIVKLVKTTKLKVQAAIQGDQVRISGKKRDDLQSVIGLLKETDLGIAMQFINFR
ncbi:MAG TPA: YajQ family cyclic di-GMP-binding protein [Vicinamibacteria bacterium]|nr:YajQ family cyclic di-GMP-binding protein [Vicinamibacteria bacterium]